MFSEKALAKFNERGFSLISTLLFFADSLRESVRAARERPRVARNILVFSTAFHAVVVVACAPQYAGQAAMFTRFLLYVAAGYAGFTTFLILNIRLLKDRAGVPAGGFGLANTFTAVRFYLIVPVIVLFAHGHDVAAVVAYVVLALSDLFDGLAARRRGEETLFGVVMDPLADVFSTFALFTLFLVQGSVPLWLYLLLVLRYVQLIVGSLVLFLTRGPIQWRATVAGKAAMAGAVLAIPLIGVSAGVEWSAWPEVEPVVFAVLGILFAWVVANQVWLGYRHIRRSGVSRGSGRRWTSKAI